MKKISTALYMHEKNCDTMFIHTYNSPSFNLFQFSLDKRRKKCYLEGLELVNFFQKEIKHLVQKRPVKRITFKWDKVINQLLANPSTSKNQGNGDLIQRLGIQMHQYQRFFFVLGDPNFLSRASSAVPQQQSAFPLFFFLSWEERHCSNS